MQPNARMHEKSKDRNLYFCVTRSCRVITFIPTPMGREVCPLCQTLGEIVRTGGNKIAEARALVEAERSRQDSKKGSSS